MENLEARLALDASLANLEAGPSETPLSTSLSGRFWLDQDEDGREDLSEPGVASVDLILRDSSGFFAGFAVTDSQGHYTFDDITPGSGYTIEYFLPFDFSLDQTLVPTKFDVGSNKAINSDFFFDRNSGLARTQIIDVLPGERIQDIDGGLLPSILVDPPAEIDEGSAATLKGKFNDFFGLGEGFSGSSLAVDPEEFASNSGTISLASADPDGPDLDVFSLPEELLFDEFPPQKTPPLQLEPVGPLGIDPLPSRPYAEIFIIWGDGSPPEFVKAVTPEDNTFSASHIYVDDLPGGDYSAEVIAFVYPDFGGDGLAAFISQEGPARSFPPAGFEFSGSEKVPVAVRNVPPAISGIPGVVILEPGGRLDLAPFWNDPGTDNGALETVEEFFEGMDWGDGSVISNSASPRPGVEVDGQSTGNLLLSHTYSDEGIFEATLTLRDDDGGRDEVTILVLVGVTPFIPPIELPPPDPTPAGPPEPPQFPVQNLPAIDYPQSSPATLDPIIPLFSAGQQRDETRQLLLKVYTLEETPTKDGEEPVKTRQLLRTFVILSAQANPSKIYLTDLEPGEYELTVQLLEQEFSFWQGEIPITLEKALNKVEVLFQEAQQRTDLIDRLRELLPSTAINDPAQAQPENQNNQDDQASPLQDDPLEPNPPRDDSAGDNSVGHTLPSDDPLAKLPVVEFELSAAQPLDHSAEQPILDSFWDQWGNHELN